MNSATHRLRRLVAPGLAAVTAVTLVGVLAPVPALAADPIDLDTAANFSVLAASAVTSVGVSTAEQDVGVSPTGVITNFPPSATDGEVHLNDTVAAEAQEDLAAAYLQATNTPVDGPLPVDLAGTTVTPGAYSSGTFLITGDFILDAEGNNQSVFIFKAGTSLDTAAGVSISFINGASPCNVFWQVGTSATLGASNFFVGTIMAEESITSGAGTEVNGRLLAMDGAVTMATNTITEPICEAAPPSPPPPGPNPPGPNPPGPDDPTLPVTGGGRDGGGAVPMLTAAGGAMVVLGALMVAWYYRRRLNRYPF